MNKLLFSFVLCALMASPLYLHAQKQQKANEIQTVYDACQKMAKAIGDGNTTSLKTASRTLRRCATKDFSILRPLDEYSPSLNGHFVFDEDFADSLIAGRDVYKFAQRYAQQRAMRGTATSGKISTRTCAIGKSSRAKFSYNGRDHMELAVVAEPGGRITLRIHDKTHDKWYNDTRDVKKGRASRLLIFDLPKNGLSQLELEVINTTKKDISFVIISN